MNISESHLLDLLTRLAEAFDLADGVPATEVHAVGRGGTAYGAIVSEEAIEVLMELNQVREELEEELGE